MLSKEAAEVILIALMMYETRECLRKINSRRESWVRPLYLSRDINGLFASSFEEMYNNDTEQFKKTVRMSRTMFDHLLGLVGERLTKHSNRPSIPAALRLFLTLNYLAHGGSQHMLAISYKMGRSTANKIVLETCEVLWDELGGIYLSIPNRHEWKRIANDFNSIWNFPNCVGAIDGKHIILKCPPSSGSLFYNYKGTYSIVLLACCDANYTFTCIDIGAYGSQSDGGVLCNSSFGRRLFNNQLDLPEDDILLHSTLRFPHFFVGDAAFPLKSYIMRPYPGIRLSPDRELFNKRLSRARRVIENAFGIMTARWRILLSPLQMHPTSAESVVKATVLLHNFLKMHDGTYCPPEFVDQYQGDNIVGGLWRQEITTPLRGTGRLMANNAARSAFNLRDQLKDYITAHPIN
ncbi:protein ALP1-like [Rhagoletis pomonella]|uniref:protein ALP1-like n=1 Tax=Rhagoletis pomonella TaxID=28610 RepID=UPI001787693F|nr:protein ALP1-like [Rhagoletis pomonella]